MDVFFCLFFYRGRRGNGVILKSAQKTRTAGGRDGRRSRSQLNSHIRQSGAQKAEAEHTDPGWLAHKGSKSDQFLGHAAPYWSPKYSELLHPRTKCVCNKCGSD